MTILAVALYDTKGDNSQVAKKYCSAQQDKELLAKSQLLLLEGTSLPCYIDSLNEEKKPNTYAYLNVSSEHHYFKWVEAAPDKIMVLVSRGSLNIIERKRLFERMERLYAKPKELKLLLEQIIENFLQFINKDLDLQKAEEQVHDVTLIANKNIKLALDGVEKLGKMEEKALDLEKQAKLFYKQSDKLNSRCCGW